MPNKPALPDAGFVRLSSIIAPARPILVSKSTWWQGVKDGRFPKPVKLGVKTTAWRVQDIRHWLRNGLEPVAGCFPAIIRGVDLIDFLNRRRASRKRPLRPGPAVLPALQGTKASCVR